MTSGPYPKITDYLEALQRDRRCLRCPKLRQAKVEAGLMGRPVCFHGAFAIVVKLEINGINKAIRMFTQRVPNAEQHYTAISPYLQTHAPSHFLQYEYDAQGITINNRPYPVLITDWLHGKTLKPFIEESLGDKKRLLLLADAWRNMIRTLLQARIAHGDLQEANIFVQTNASGDHLKLLDYDSLVVPELEGLPETIIGVDAYQHPQRCNVRHKSLNVDTFSALAIDLSIRAFAYCPDLWERWEIEDLDGSLLLDARDYSRPNESPKIQYLRTIQELKPLVTALTQYCNSPDPLALEPVEDVWFVPEPPSWIQNPPKTPLSWHEIAKPAISLSPPDWLTQPLPRSQRPQPPSTQPTEPPPTWLQKTKPPKDL